MPLLTLLVISLTACQPKAPEPVREVVRISGHLRYEQETNLLRAELVQADTSLANPLFMGQPMREVTGTAPKRFTGSVKGITGQPLFSVLLPDGNEDIAVPMKGVYIDSLPASFSRDSTVNFMVGEQGLGAEESLLLFFEPEEMIAPRRILITGPTTSGMVSLPPPALVDLPVGNYRAYLVKQQLYKEKAAYLRTSIQTEFFTASRPVTVR